MAAATSTDKIFMRERSITIDGLRLDANSRPGANPPFVWKLRLSSDLLNEMAVNGLAAHPENMRRLNFRVQLDVVSPAVPGVAGIAQQIVHLISFAFKRAELVDRHIDVRMLLS